MRKTGRFLCLLLALLMVLPLAVACQNNADTPPDDPVSDAPTGSETDPPAATLLDVVRDGKAATIVYPAKADADVLELVNNLNGTLQKMTGLSGLRPQVEGKYDASAVEILIGAVSYPESTQVYETLGYGEGAVCVVGNKVVVGGYDTAACKRALSSLIVTLNSNRDKDGNIALSATYSTSIADRPLIADLPTMPKTYLPKVEDAGQGCAKLTFEGVPEAAFRAYLPKLEQEGYTKYAENQIDGNLYYTYYNADSVVSVMYVDRTAAPNMLVTVDPLTATSLIPSEAENTGADSTLCTTTFTQVGLYYDVNKSANEAAKNMQNFNGMCYVMRLNDGRFIVIDGGHNTQGHADRLYEVLKKQSPNGNIVIAAWFFSHDHGDHVGFFSYFTTSYASQVTVERFVHNFPFTSANTVVALMNRYNGAKIVKSHPGQKHYLANAEIEILYTADLYATNVESMADTNNASQVFTVKVNGTKFMILGDYSENAATVLNLYGNDTLKSDVVQIAHHGISGMGTTLYEKIRPTYAFWPVAMLENGHVYWKDSRDIDVDLKGRSENAYFFNSMNYETNVFVANDDVYVATSIANGTLSVAHHDTVQDYLNSGT